MTSRVFLCRLLVVAISILSAACGSTKKASIGPTGGSEICPTRSAGPTGLAPLPSAPQLAYQRTELTAFIHFGMATFDGTEQGNMSVDQPSLFNPTNLDATAMAQWVGAFKAAGIGQAMLVAKHSTGFCLWPTATTSFSVKSSPWMGGQGDVVKLFTDAMHAAGLKVAFYLAPWDQSYPSSKADYEAYFKTQLTELLTNYGPVHEIEFDGFNAPTSNVDWKSVFALARQLQPDILVWAGPRSSTPAQFRICSGSATRAEWRAGRRRASIRATAEMGTLGAPTNVTPPIARPTGFGIPTSRRCR